MNRNATTSSSKQQEKVHISNFNSVTCVFASVTVTRILLSFAFSLIYAFSWQEGPTHSLPQLLIFFMRKIYPVFILLNKKEYEHATVNCIRLNYLQKYAYRNAYFTVFSPLKLMTNYTDFTCLPSRPQCFTISTLQYPWFFSWLYASAFQLFKRRILRFDLDLAVNFLQLLLYMDRKTNGPKCLLGERKTFMANEFLQQNKSFRPLICLCYCQSMYSTMNHCKTSRQCCICDSLRTRLLSC